MKDYSIVKTVINQHGFIRQEDLADIAEFNDNRMRFLVRLITGERFTCDYQNLASMIELAEKDDQGRVRDVQLSPDTFARWQDFALHGKEREKAFAK